jgi:hypothetical protein
MTFALAACSAGPPTVPPTASPPAEASAPAPDTTSPPSPSAASDETSTPATEPTATPDAPAAVLIADGERFDGEIGGYTFGLTTSSAPWLPARALAPVALEPGTVLRVELDGRATVASWTARLAAADDPTADNVTGLGNGSGPIVEFGGPAAGEWVVSVGITYGGGLGEGAYYWYLVVD